MMEANWLEMPDDINRIIAKQLPVDVEEIVKFSAVCKAWSPVALKEKLAMSRCAPWLMLHKKENDDKVCDDDEHGIRSFYSISSKKVFNLNLPTQGRRCWGTPFGWVITMGIDLNINLLNPLSGRQISLPPQTKLPNQYHMYVKPLELCKDFVTKFALASDPSSWSSTTAPESVQCPQVMVIYGQICELAFASPGDKTWTRVKGPHGANNKDVIFFKGCYYAVNNNGVLGLCEINTTKPKATYFACPPDCVDPVNMFYLIEISGDLHLVAREFYSCDGDGNRYKQEYMEEDEYEEVDGDGDENGSEDELECNQSEEYIDEDEDEDEDEDGSEQEQEQEDEHHCVETGHEHEQFVETEDEYESYWGDYHYETKHFLVFKFDFHTRKWTKLEDLGHNALFLGNNVSFAISTSEFPEFKCNCIYFTDDHSDVYCHGFCDMGVYDISKDTVESIYTDCGKLSNFSRPLFFMPTPPW